MKKSLVALAALAVVGAASAQSSVTLYGVVDAGVARVTGTKFAMTGSGLMNNGTSRFGFKGSEDLGGGMKANFNMEAGFDPETGAGNLSGGNLFSRAANVSLSGGFGEFRMGRSLTPSFYGVAAWELTGTANYSVVASQFNFAGAGPRQSSQFMYVSPSMGGFSGSVAYTARPDTGTPAAAAVYTLVNGLQTLKTAAVASVPNGAKVDANLIYSAGPLAVGFSANRTDVNAVAATAAKLATPTAFAVNAAPGTPAYTSTNYALGAKYNFGMFQVAGSVQDSGKSPMDPAGNSKGFTLGAGANLGPVALVVDIARDTYFEDTNVLFEAKYPLSKRTFAYAAYLNDGARAATATTAAVTRTRGASIGLRHNF